MLGERYCGNDKTKSLSFTAAVLGLLATLATKTHAHARIYQSQEAFWSYVVDVNPSARSAQLNLIAVNKCELKVDRATHAAAKYACENWHYSRCTPKFKQVWIGAWERGQFIGVVAFGRSSTPYLGTQFNLETTECAELTRIALKNHETPVSQIMARAIKMIKKQSPGMRLLVSLADPGQGHNGAIYQATNWIYVGRSSRMTQYYFREKWRNDSSLMRHLQKFPKLKTQLPVRSIEGKHKYLMPLDKEMRKRILPLSRPYPKRASSDTGDTPDHQSGKGGSIPTDALQPQPEGKP